MRKIVWNDWHFEIHTDTMQRYYETCPESVKISVKDGSPLVRFAEQLGIDLQKPLKYSENFDDVVFVAFGTAASAEGYELDFYENTGVISAVIYPHDMMFNLPMPNFLIEFFGFRALLA